MPTASTSTSALFTVLALGMAGLVAVILRRHLAGSDTRSISSTVPALFVVFYVVVPAGLAATGLLDRYEPVPASMLLVLLLTATTIVVGVSPLGVRLGRSIGLAGLVGFQAFRIPVELLLHRLSTEGVIPTVMTYSGVNFDILSGMSAAVLGLLLLRRTVSPRTLLAWNVFGLILLANIVVIAVLSTPVPFRVFTQGPPNLLPSTFPFVWLPTVLVQAALFGHLLLFQKLRGRAAT